MGIAGADAGAVSVVALQGLLQLRSQRDLFAFGAIFYEMLSGKRAFHGASPADTMSAILKEDPPELTETGRQIPLALEGIVRHCLEKNPQRRFQSAQDLAFNLEQLSQSSGSHVTGGESGTQAAARSVGTAGRARSGGSRRHRFHRGAVRWSRGKTEFSPTDISAGPVLQARFSPDGQTIYSAAWNGQPSDVYSTRADRPGARSLDLKGGQVLALSTAGDLAIPTKVKASETFADTGTLATYRSRAALRTKCPRTSKYADFSPDGTELAIIRDLGGVRGRLEYPVGKSLYDTFGSLVVTDTAGHRTVLEKDWYEMMDMAWSPRGDEIWFTGSDQNSQRSLYAVTLDGKKRPLLEVPGNLVLKDAFRDGRILLVRENAPRELSAVLAGEPKERDLSWFDWTFPTDISPDGNTFVFHEAGVGGGKDFSEFLRKTDGSPPGLLGAGAGGELSPDGKWVLASSAHSPVQLLLFPTGAGEPGRLTTDRSPYPMRSRPSCAQPDSAHRVATRITG